MTVSQANALVGQLSKADRRGLFDFLLSTLVDFAKEHADDVLRSMADAVDELVAMRPPLVRLAVGFATKALRFAADRVEASA